MISDVPEALSAETKSTSMKQALNSLTIIGALALLTFATGCATTGTHSTEMLNTAGFRPYSADTPQKQELLKSLQPDHISLITWKGKQLYVQPDVPNNRALVGTAAHYHAYLELRRAQQMRNDALMAAQIDAASMTRWGVWGPSMSGIYRRF
jgi:hypothetical protein